MKTAICPVCKKKITVDLDLHFFAHGKITKQTAPGKMDFCVMSDKPIDRGWWSREVRPLPRHSRADYVVEQFRAGRITDYQLWEILSIHKSPIPVVDAVQAYIQLGFKPFSGYPLTPLTSMVLTGIGVLA